MMENKIPARAIAMLVAMKQSLLSDNDLCLKVCNLGKLAMASYTDDLIGKACKLETLYYDYYCNYKITKGLLDEIVYLMEGYTPDALTNERLEELKALIHKWREQDNKEDADAEDD